MLYPSVLNNASDILAGIVERFGHIAASCSRNKPSKRPRKHAIRNVETTPIADPIIITPHEDSSSDTMKILISLLPETQTEVSVPSHPVDSSFPSTLTGTVAPHNHAAPQKIVLKRLRALLKSKTPYERPATRSQLVLTQTSSLDLADTMLIDTNNTSAVAAVGATESLPPRTTADGDHNITPTL